MCVFATRGRYIHKDLAFGCDLHTFEEWCTCWGGCLIWVFALQLFSLWFYWFCWALLSFRRIGMLFFLIASSYCLCIWDQVFFFLVASRCCPCLWGPRFAHFEWTSSFPFLSFWSLEYAYIYFAFHSSLCVIVENALIKGKIETTWWLCAFYIYHGWWVIVKARWSS